MKKSAIAVALAALALAACGAEEKSSTANEVTYLSDYSLKGSRNFLTGYEPGPNVDGSYNMVVEIPANETAKWEICTAGAIADAVAFPECQGTSPGDRMVWEVKAGARRETMFLGYPGNYGSMPRTLALDGDPLDVVGIGGALPKGSVSAFRVIGILDCDDGGDHDDKVIGLLPDSPLYATVNDLTLSTPDNVPALAEILITWFQSYKGATSSLTGCVALGPSEAFTAIDAATALFLAPPP